MNYLLKTKLGEPIHKCKASSKGNAELYFAKVKGLEVNDLLRIYDVVEVN